MPTEAEYLTLQAARAKARLRASAALLADELLDPLDVRRFVQRRPWWSLGGAALAGFLSGRSLRRGRRTAGASRAGGKVHEMIAAVTSRLRRVVGSALGAMAVASLRGGAPRPASTPTNGHAAKAPSAAR